MLSFPGDLERACAASNLPIDRTSREPHYKFQDGFLELDIDAGKHLAHLKDREAELATLPADIGAVVEAVRAEHQRLFQRPFDGEKFLRKLRSHYLAVIKKEGLKDGEPCQFAASLIALEKTRKAFTRTSSWSTLSRLAEKGRSKSTM